MVTFTLDPAQALRETLAAGGYQQVVALADTNTQQLLPRLAEALAEAPVITINAGDQHKTIDSACHVWHELQQAGATRHSVLVNVGGGMVTDMGGFVATTYKRGMAFINVPTSLLGAVDAAIGGKTGVNFDGLKNQVGAFAQAAEVIISPSFFDTLPLEERLSGFAEMVKHALLNSDSALTHVLRLDVTAPDVPNASTLLELLRESVQVKQSYVEADPLESGSRKALNLGHTVGHACESLMLERGTPVSHGTAVAWGLVAELVLSHMTLQFDSALLHEVANMVRSRYAAPEIECRNYDQLLQLMRRDKKSTSGEINCTLLRHCGQPATDCTIDPEEMRTALDIFRDLMGV